MVGTRFVPEGRLVGVGLDCVGVLVLAAAAAGIELEDQRGYFPKPNPSRLVAALEAQLDRLDALRDGCVVAFWRHHPRLVHHVGIVVQTDPSTRVVHALMESPRRVVETHLPNWVGVHSSWRFRA